MLEFDDAPAQPSFPKAKGSVLELIQRLTTAWLDAQVASYEIADADTQLVLLAKRLNDADAWFRGNAVDHPRYGEASVLRRDLEAQEKSTKATYHGLLLRCWTACTSVYVLLWSLPEAQRQVWLAQQFPDVLVVATDAPDHPMVLWFILMGVGRPAPGNWPHEERDLWVGRANQVEYWHQEILQARLREWQER